MTKQDTGYWGYPEDNFDRHGNPRKPSKNFTIEMAFDVPHYRQHTYEAETLEEAIALAKADDNWDDQKKDYDCSGPERITGAWEGEAAYTGPDLLPSEILEPIRPLRALDNGAAYYMAPPTNYVDQPRVDYGEHSWPSRSYWLIPLQA